MVYVQTKIIMQLFFWIHCLSQVRRPPNITYPDKDMVLYYGDNQRVILNCAAYGEPKPIYRWLVNGSNISVGHDYLLDEDTGDLTIANFSRSLGGFYRCVATGFFEPVNTTRRHFASAVSPALQLLVIRIGPMEHSVILTHDVYEYDYFNLSCDDNGTSVAPNLTYNWYYQATKSPVRLYGGRLFVDKHGELHFMYVNSDDERHIYVCGISALVGQAHQTMFGKQNRLNVSHEPAPNNSTPPVLKYISTRVVGRRLSTVTLECMFAGYEKENGTIHPITWTHASGTGIRNSTKYSITPGGNRLTIRNVTKEDEKQYSCVASNSGGDATASVHLDVISEPVFQPGPPTDQIVVEGTDSVFTCNATSVTGERAVTAPVWYINNASMENSYDSTKFLLSQDMKQLTIKNPQKATDIICVQCEVSNDVGTVFANACLNVLLPITIVSAPPREQTVSYGDEINLTVKATTDPALHLQYRWEFGRGAFDIDTAPHFMTIDRQTMTVILDTSLMTTARFSMVEGRYRIVVYHQYEIKSVETRVHKTEMPGKETSTGNSSVKVGTDSTTWSVVWSSTPRTSLSSTPMTPLYFTPTALKLYLLMTCVILVAVGLFIFFSRIRSDQSKLSSGESSETESEYENDDKEQKEVVTPKAKKKKPKRLRRRGNFRYKGGMMRAPVYIPPPLPPLDNIPQLVNDAPEEQLSEMSDSTSVDPAGQYV